MEKNEILELNRKNYEDMYAREEAFLRYPSDWILRFHNMFLKNELPEGGSILDYGCGSGNNAMFFLEKGYSVTGFDVSPSFKNLVSKNLDLHKLDPALVSNFHLMPPDTLQLDFPDNHFDFVLSNQVLYYLPSREHVKKLCQEFKRVLRPGGIVFFTVMGPHNYYMTHHLKAVHAGGVGEIRVEEEGHRLQGLREFILRVKDEKDLCALFDTFKMETWGYFDQRMFDMVSNFHYIFVGRNQD